MKSLFVTTIFCCLISAAFAQKTFKELTLTDRGSKYSNGVTQSDRMSRHAQINLKDSVISITKDGSADTYKMIDMEDERTAIYEDQRTIKYYVFHVKDKNGKLWTVQLQRRTQPNTKNIMILNISDGAGEFTNYTCDYLKEL
jgi:hypothetical protein